MKLLDASHEIARFIFSLKDFSFPTPSVRIKKSALVPMTNDQGELETSVMLTTGLSDTSVDELGMHVSKLRNESLVAAVQFNATIVYETELKVDHDKNGHENHCSIKGWPAAKEDRIEKASDLADAITAHQSKKFKKY